MPTILVVDDSEVDRRLVGGLLQQDAEFQVEYAENGSVALSCIEQRVPDLVVTDLQMPEKDGLELVTAMRIHHSNVPVILMTAHGSESLAVEALEQGAASYVPKAQLSKKLLNTVEDVLALTRADRSYERLIQRLDRTEFDFSLDNDSQLIDPLVDLVQQMVAGMGLCDVNSRFRVGVALKEALLNAMYRGNLEISFQQMQEARENLIQGGGVDLVDERRRALPYCERQIEIQIRIDTTEARFVIRDDGPGFDVDSVNVPGDISALEPESGRGLVLMRAFMDEVNYNQAGNEVTLVKRRETAPRAARRA